ncbi:MAG: hypothetical protein QM727_04340 [Niabella sp.]
MDLAYSAKNIGKWAIFFAMACFQKYLCSQMRISSYIMDILQIDNTFCTTASSYFQENAGSIKSASELTLNTVFFSFSNYGKKANHGDELLKMIKAAGEIEFSQDLVTYLDHEMVMIKGSGFVSELFNENFNDLVAAVAQIHQLKSGTVNKLFQLLTTIMLNAISKGFNLENVDGRKMLNILAHAVVNKAHLPKEIDSIFNKISSGNKERKIRNAIQNARNLF